MKQRGSALVLALIVMALLAAVVIALSRNSEIDLFIGRNTKLMKQAFLWSDSGLEVGEEIITYSEDTRGDDANSTFSKTLPDGTKFEVINNGPPIYNSTTTSNIELKINDTTVSNIKINYLGSLTTDGTSIIFAAGYEGVGKGLAGGGAYARIYSIYSKGVSDNGLSEKRSAEVFSSLSSGK